jgi:hypothetical protein
LAIFGSRSAAPAFVEKYSLETSPKTAIWLFTEEP